MLKIYDLKIRHKVVGWFPNFYFINFQKLFLEHVQIMLAPKK